MKYSILVLSLLLLSWPIQGVAQSNIRGELTSQELLALNEFGQSLFEAFKKNSIKNFEKLHPNKNISKAGIEFHITDEKMKQSMLEELEKTTKAEIDEEFDKFNERFIAIYGSAKEHNIDWETTEFLKMDYNFKLESFGMKNIQCDLVFTHENVSYEIDMKSLVCMKGVWYLSDFSWDNVKISK